MAMKSREGKFPPADALSELLYHWMRTWPHARITKAETERLYPYIVEKWRDGWSLPEIAQTACSCDEGGNISPSAVALNRVPRGLTRPPEGAKPGDTFGADELQDVRSVASLRSAVAVAQMKAEQAQTQVRILDEKLRLAKGSSRDRLLTQRQKAQGEVEKLLAQVRAQATRLQSMEQYGPTRTTRQPKREAVERPTSPAAPAAPKAPKAPKTPKPAKASAAPKAAPTPAPAAPAPTASVPSAAATDDAIENELADLFKDE